MGVTKSELNDIARAAEDGKNMRRPVCLIFTSEITVELRGRGGMGGPCQEVALATAIALRKRHKESETFRVGNARNNSQITFQGQCKLVSINIFDYVIQAPSRLDPRWA